MGSRFFKEVHANWLSFENFEKDPAMPLSIRSAGQMSSRTTEYHFSSADNKSWNSPDTHTFQYIISGTFDFSIIRNGIKENFVVPEQHICIMSKDIDYELKQSKNEYCEWLWLNIEGESADLIIKNIISRKRIFKMPVNAAPILCIKALLTAGIHKNLNKYDMLSAASEFLIRFQEFAAVAELSESEKILRDIESFINENIKTADVETLAAKCGYSAKYFQAYFRKLTAKTPGELIRTLRLQYALRLLSHSDAKLSEIAETSGFTDASHLCRIFRKEFNESPENWRIGMQNKNNPFYKSNLRNGKIKKGMQDGS